MSALTAPELRPGLCAFLDPAVLGQDPAVRSNVRTRANLVNRPGPFLLAALDPDGAFLCTPLISHDGKGRVALDNRLKSGPGHGWTLRHSFFSVHQFWIIPPAALLAASNGEFSPVGNRQRYADRDPAALADVARHRFSSDAPYRPVTALR